MPSHYAVTGNIGSGKTTVCRMFERMGVPVYYADAAAKRLMHENRDLRSALTSAFGSEVYGADGRLNRRHLAGRVFADDAALARLNGLVHPAVHADAARWRTRQVGVPYTLYEAAIVLELGRADDFSGVIVVAAPEAVRARRVMRRDGVDHAAFAARAAKQWPDRRKEDAADFLIQNDGTRLLLPQVLRFDHEARRAQPAAYPGR